MGPAPHISEGVVLQRSCFRQGRSCQVKAKTKKKKAEGVNGPKGELGQIGVWLLGPNLAQNGGALSLHDGVWASVLLLPLASGTCVFVSRLTKVQ